LDAIAITSRISEPIPSKVAMSTELLSLPGSSPEVVDVQRYVRDVCGGTESKKILNRCPQSVVSDCVT
jgi:hypothetical protein